MAGLVGGSRTSGVERQEAGVEVRMSVEKQASQVRKQPVEDLEAVGNDGFAGVGREESCRGGGKVAEVEGAYQQPGFAPHGVCAAVYEAAIPDQVWE